MPPSVIPRKQATMSAPRPSAAPATACCRWYPSITVRGSSRLAITVFFFMFVHDWSISFFSAVLKFGL
ncbi:Os12g0299150 [Oryza sativa Japonica Group]|uniref:Os12g0299150 protein n=2 Tax=Oryza sativa subsp. japonica TaxID=39947 RepID=C7J9U6_ORYSJ|nr:Os12g0299150 [Oryza sativa Japonica Group]BAT16813.1 Os12g0299150 [Oryza sativa Japonica Group]|eukprot:NP_001176911.1 Os12g0299150 [Oryza sativa Japonica Group]